MANNTPNPMQKPRLDKVTLNIGAGTGGEKLQNAKTLLERVSGGVAVITHAHDRAPEWGVRKGDAIGVKITLRGAKALHVLKNSLQVVENTISPRSFDKSGNFAFGVKEYIDYPGLKYDPKIGMMGFDCAVTLSKPGARVSRRKISPKKLPMKQRVSRDEAMEWAKETLGIKIEEPVAEYA
ncbi:MAG TPA: 50S ribosomal protein L5 [Candidatus Norongarragalinales archaeon]|jgi:large subunit ribosomal protein L5|nr:50S ribosomal protein L5 [Candidatus Norongarragalinales archaeon]